MDQQRETSPYVKLPVVGITRLNLELGGGAKVTLAVFLRVISDVELLPVVGVLEGESPIAAALSALTVILCPVERFGDGASVGGQPYEGGDLGRAAGLSGNSGTSHES